MNIFKIFLIWGVFSNIVADIQILINPVNLPENSLPGTELSRAYDKDVAGKPNAYRFLNKTKDFVIDENSGVITATKIFNYETDPTRFLFIVDTGGIMRHVLTINIIDVPEPPDCTADPLFSSGSATFEIAEDYPLFQSIYRVNVTDEDIAHGDRLTYSIETELSGPKRGANSFGVDPVNGIVSLRGEDALDFDAGYHTFQLSVRATDSAGLFCQGTIIINIRNINDETPQFEPFPMDSINVTEKKPTGSFLARVKATDRDKDSSIMYSFKTQQEMFGLDPFTGVITVLQSLNLDNPSNSRTYSLEIEARDDGNNTSSYMFTVFVENVDDPISCDPKFSKGAGVSVSVAENTPSSAFIYAILSRDPDLGQEVEFFQLVIAVRNRDSLSLESCVGTITINIQNVNDESPVLIYKPDAPLIINENLPVGTKLAKFTATDRDIEDTVHYEFISIQKEFAINEDFGDVTVAYPLDYEDVTTPKSWVLYVRVYDNERTHSTTGTFTVILQDVNDNPPRCSQDIYVIELPENIPVDTSLVSLTCTDLDGTIPNNNVTYHLIKDTFSNKTFTLTKNELKIGPMHLDYDNSVFSEMDFKYTLFIRVSDEGIPALSTIIRIILRVSRINEHSPIGTMMAFTFSVFENSPIDTLVGKITYTDGDWPFNNIQYAIVGGNFGIPPKFYIESDSGMIKLLNSVDRETVSQYKIAVRITDVANDALPDPIRQRSSTAQVTIHVLNVNDEPPVCSPPHLEIQMYARFRGPLIRLNCLDKDSPQNHLSYSITEGNTNNQFTLWREGAESPFLATGQHFQDDLFQGTQDGVTFQLLIEVTDELGENSASQLTATTTVIIHVLPWTTTQPTSSRKITPTTITTSVLRKISYYWSPDTWFPAVFTLTGALFLMCLYAVAWCLFKDVPACSRLFPWCHRQQSQPCLTEKEAAQGLRYENSLSVVTQPNSRPNLLPGNYK
ncbi:cadherin-related family member 3 [Cricetulus griseus]|uniref:Cadherin-related family member 3 n=1 Tax=Cricetulus griseus TaxID=10029 RepID=A0A9J7HB95_CRIGR|nr:cadherin-related family member 3 [Cricetulus griseus]XP_035313714.1 cadherin-related family member 3 [Cricetulus griseus]